MLWGSGRPVNLGPNMTYLGLGFPKSPWVSIHGHPWRLDDFGVPGTPMTTGNFRFWPWMMRGGNSRWFWCLNLLRLCWLYHETGKLIVFCSPGWHSVLLTHEKAGHLRSILVSSTWGHLGGINLGEIIALSTTVVDHFQWYIYSAMLCYVPTTITIYYHYFVYSLIRSYPYLGGTC